LPKVY